MKQHFILSASVLAIASAMTVQAAHAVTIKNAGSEAQIVQVTENGERRELTIAATGEVQVCPKGCFMSFATGDVLALSGPETVVIEGGKARIIAR